MHRLLIFAKATTLQLLIFENIYYVEHFLSCKAKKQVCFFSFFIQSFLSFTMLLFSRVDISVMFKVATLGGGSSLPWEWPPAGTVPLLLGIDPSRAPELRCDPEPQISEEPFWEWPPAETASQLLGIAQQGHLGLAATLSHRYQVSKVYCVTKRPDTQGSPTPPFLLRKPWAAPLHLWGQHWLSLLT